MDYTISTFEANMANKKNLDFFFPIKKKKKKNKILLHLLGNQMGL